MAYNEEQKAAFKQQAAGRRRNQIVLEIPLAIGLIASELVNEKRVRYFKNNTCNIVLYQKRY